MAETELAETLQIRIGPYCKTTVDDARITMVSSLWTCTMWSLIFLSARGSGGAEPRDLFSAAAAMLRGALTQLLRAAPAR